MSGARPASLSLVIALTAMVAGCADPAGEAPEFAAGAFFATECASCHSAGLFGRMSGDRVFRTLNAGIMAPFAGDLTADQRQTLARYIAPTDPVPLPASAYCQDRRIDPDLTAPAWNGWSPAAGNTRYQARPGISIDDVDDLELAWAFGFGEDLSSYSQPAVVGESLFVGSNAGTVYALNRRSGCIHWTFEAQAPVRTAILLAPMEAGHAVLFGDQTGRFFAVAAADGSLLWTVEPDEHPAARITGSPVVHDGVVFVPVASWEETLATIPDYQCCTFRGSVAALRVETGEEVWTAHLQAETPEPTDPSTDGRLLWGPSGSPVWSTPTVDPNRNLLYVATGNNYTGPATGTSDAVLALSLASGETVWTRQLTPNDTFSGCATCTPERGPDFDFGSSVILTRSPEGRDVLLAGQKSGVVYGLDPDDQGAVVWETRVAQGTSHGGVQWGMATDGSLVYVPIADGDLITVVEEDGVSRRRMDPDDGGGLAALRIGDGRVVWEAPPFRVCAAIPNCSPSQLAAATVIPGVVFSGAMDGHLRAYAAESGDVVWDVDTGRTYPTVNGVEANGGALNGNGVVVVDGMVFVNSGYNHFGTMTGNVLLVFASADRVP